MEITNTLWVEKYRPISLKDYIGNETLKKVFDKFIQEEEIKNIILFGTAGTGKTTAAKLLVKNIPCDVLMINASDENNIETIRVKVKQFASTVSIKGNYKVVILDEADGLTPQAQKSLRFLIEEFSSSTRFILTCNYIENIIPALKSRCKPYEVVPPTKEQVFDRLVEILNNEKVKYTKEDVESIIELFFPDVRACIETLQQNVFIGELSINKTSLINNDYCQKIIDIILDTKKFKDFDNDFATIKQALVDGKSATYNELYNSLYENIDMFKTSSKISEAINIIAEMQYWSNFAFNKEITAMTLVNKLYELFRK